MDVIPPDSTPYLFHRPLINSTTQNFIARKRIQIEVDITKFTDKITKDLKRELDLAVSPTLFERLCGGVHIQVRKLTVKAVNIYSLICIRLYFLSRIPH